MGLTEQKVSKRKPVLDCSCLLLTPGSEGLIQKVPLQTQGSGAKRRGDRQTSLCCLISSWVRQNRKQHKGLCRTVMTPREIKGHQNYHVGLFPSPLRHPATHRATSSFLLQVSPTLAEWLCSAENSNLQSCQLAELLLPLSAAPLGIPGSNLKSPYGGGAWVFVAHYQRASTPGSSPASPQLPLTHPFTPLLKSVKERRG